MEPEEKRRKIEQTNKKNRKKRKDSNEMVKTPRMSDSPMFAMNNLKETLER